jgi:hypothetical protein
MLVAELQRACFLQSISASIEAVCRKTLRDVNARFRDKTRAPKIPVKNYMSQKTLQLGLPQFSSVRSVRGQFFEGWDRA